MGQTLSLHTGFESVHPSEARTGRMSIRHPDGPVVFERFRLLKGGGRQDCLPHQSVLLDFDASGFDGACSGSVQIGQGFGEVGSRADFAIAGCDQIGLAL